MDRIQQRIEGAVERGIRQGDFDNLPGAGKPLDLGDPNDPNWWIKKYATQEKLDLAECLPERARLQRESEEFLDTVAGFATEAEVTAAVQDLNDRIAADATRTYAQVLPWHPAPVDEATAIAAWQASQPAVPKPPAAIPTATPDKPGTPWWRRLLFGTSG